MSDWLDVAIDAALEKVSGQMRLGRDFPHITEQGNWCYTEDGVWTGGFWVGLLWLAYEQRPGEELKAAARAMTERLLPRAADKVNHDLGFMFYPSVVKAWRLTGEERYRVAGIEAANSLASQFNPAGGFIPGWGFFGREDWLGSVLIDTLMNLPLLLWAAGNGGDAGLLEVARAHALTARSNHQRENGSVYHVFRFDPATGEPIAGGTYQGMAPSSTWSRGQGWALAGLSMLADMSGDAGSLAAAQRVAAYVRDHLPQDGVPLWDYDAAPDAVRDSSAGAITAYGLVRLWRQTGDAGQLALAERMLRALSSDCMADRGAAPILKNATADLPHGLGIDESTIYGDYYFLKALLALREARA